jgi:hypothetical protein
MVTDDPSSSLLVFRLMGFPAIQIEAITKSAGHICGQSPIAYFIGDDDGVRGRMARAVGIARALP